MDALFLIVSKMTACENCHVRFCFNIDKTDSCRAFFFCKVSMAQTILEMFVVDGLKNKNHAKKSQPPFLEKGLLCEQNQASMLLKMPFFAQFLYSF